MTRGPRPHGTFPVRADDARDNKPKLPEVRASRPPTIESRRDGRKAGPAVKIHSKSLPVVALITLLWLAIAPPAVAYNDQQHQGMTVLAYKAMVGTALENGCNPPIDFQGIVVTDRLTDVPGPDVCAANDQTCIADWAEFLRQIDRAIRYLRGVDAALPASANCPTALDPTGNLGDIRFSVNTNYARSGGCGVDSFMTQNAAGKTRFCSSPEPLCDQNSIYQFLAPEDHTGDILGYWTTEADHDVSVIGLGFKPVYPGVGKTLQTLDTVAEDALGAVLVPIVCAFEALFGGEDCVKDARALADDAVPIEDIASVIPVLFPRHDANFTGLWHFIDFADPNSPCDDVRGMLYERAGPLRIPDALDLLILIGTELGQQTVSFDDSTGPSRFNITNPGDGDQPSCSRGRPEWEIAPMGHIVFNPVDNLALYGWTQFSVVNGGHNAKMLGWPLHALGDAVEPHHVVGTTGWGHRPFEESLEKGTIDGHLTNWTRILYQDLANPGDVRSSQYLQLRRILHHGFSYWRMLNTFRAQRPNTSTLNTIPIRALVTQVAADTYAEITGPDGSPGWPFNPTLSVPWWIDLGARTATVNFYTDTNSVDRQRQLIESGAGASLAFLTAIGQLGAPFAAAPRCGGANALFAECGASSECSGTCCMPTPVTTACVEPCAQVTCNTGSLFCSSTCSSDHICGPDNCCIPVQCDAPCRSDADCDSGSCASGCCGSSVLK